jgi:sugar phosphate isomerase/epimerase
MRRGELDLDAVEHGIEFDTEPLLDPIAGSGDLDLFQSDRSGKCLRQHRRIGAPLDEVGQLGVGHQTAHAELLPLQEAPVGEMSRPVNRLPVQTLLEIAQVIDRNDPAHPAATHFGAGSDCLAEGGLLRSRVLKHLDYLQITAIGQRENAVLGAEARVKTAVTELIAQEFAEPFRLRLQSLGADSEGQMIDMHDHIVAAAWPVREIEASGGLFPAQPQVPYAPNMDNVTTSTGAPPPVGLSSSSVYPESTAAAFALASRLGFTGVEVMVGMDPVSADSDALAELSDYHQMPVTAVHAPTLLLTQRVWGPDPWEKLERSAQAAQALGAGVVVVHPPFRWQRSYAASFTEGIRDLERRTGLVFAVENMYPWRGPAGGEVRAYAPTWDAALLDCDHLALDFSHAAIARQSALALVHDWGERLRHVHLTDGTYGPTDQHLLPGEGDQNPAAVLAGLAASAFDGQVVVEVSTRGMNRAERTVALAKTLAFAREHLTRPQPPVG